MRGFAPQPGAFPVFLLPPVARAMITFLHTADWQIGKTFGQFEADEAAHNEVVARASLPSTSALFGARFDAIVDVRNSTIIMRSPLDMFFRLGWAPFGELTGTAWARASIFASTAASAPQNVGEVAPSTNFTREWCGFFQSTADFASHSVVVDPVSGVYQAHAPAAFALDSDYAPTTLALRDACRTPTTFDRDFYGRSYNTNLEPTSPVHADIGAVEAQLVPDIFKNGFE